MFEGAKLELMCDCSQGWNYGRGMLGCIAADRSPTELLVPLMRGKSLL